MWSYQKPFEYKSQVNRQLSKPLKNLLKKDIMKLKATSKSRLEIAHYINVKSSLCMKGIA